MKWTRLWRCGRMTHTRKCNLTPFVSFFYLIFTSYSRKKKRREAKEIKPEEMTETIGDTLVGDDPNSESTTQRMYIIIYIYPDTTKHQSKPWVYKSDIAPCGQI